MTLYPMAPRIVPELRQEIQAVVLRAESFHRGLIFLTLTCGHTITHTNSRRAHETPTAWCHQCAGDKEHAHKS